ncbi:MAG: LysR family transcriptional regulator [Nevskiales bacterium]|nr:LysR family transcriptional regulator [Nevskiales bacterium]
MRLNLNLLRMFHAVVERQSFSRAAEALFVTQSAVSKGIRELEAQLGLPLIDRPGSPRGARGVRLTDDGHALYQHARGIFAMERVALEEVRDRVELRRGHLRIGASTTVAAYWLADAVSRYVRAYPQIAFELRVGNTGEIARAIQDGGLDAAFVEGRVDAPGIEVTPWCDDPLRIVAAASSPLVRRRTLRADLLAQEVWLLRERGSGTRQAADEWLTALGVEPAATVEIGSNEAIAQAVAAGAGVAVLPAVVVADLVAVGRVSALKLPRDSRRLRPLYRLELRNRPHPPALAAFLECVAVAVG